MKLSKVGQRLLKKGKKLHVVASANTRDVGGNRAQTSAPMLLKSAGR